MTENKSPEPPKVTLSSPKEVVYFESGPSYQQSVRWEALLQRVMKDEQFRHKLIENPKQTLREAGFDIPDEVNIIVHEYNPREQHLFLPPADFKLLEPEVAEAYNYKYQGEVDNG